MPALNIPAEEQAYFYLASEPAREWFEAHVRPTQTRDTEREIAEQTGGGVEPPLGRLGVTTAQASRSMQQFTQAANWWGHAIGSWGDYPWNQAQRIAWTTFDTGGISGRFPSQWSRYGQPDVTFLNSQYDSARHCRETIFADESVLMIRDVALANGAFRGIFLDGHYAGRLVSEREYNDLFSIRTEPHTGRRVINFAEPVQFSIHRGDLSRYEPPRIHRYEAQIYTMPHGASPNQFVVMRAR